MPETQSADSAHKVVSFPVDGKLGEVIQDFIAIREAQYGVDLSSLNFPHLDQYLGIWAMEERQFLAGFDLIKRTNLSVHIQQVKLAREKGQEKAENKADNGDGDSGSYGLIGITKSGVAIVSLSGTLMKYQTSMTKSTSTVMLRRTLRMLGRNEDVAAVLIVVDSPGGTVSGTSDLADEVAALAAIKPTAIYVEDLAASAAYWIASQGLWISAGRTSLIGSIGTYAVVEDSSAAAAMQGIKVHVVRAGAYKGSGVEGTPVTPEQLTEIQRIVSGLNDDFLGGVAKGRKMSLDQVKAIADGRVHKAPDALAMKLIDYVESFDAALARLEAKVGSGGGSKQRNNGGGRSVAEGDNPARVEGPNEKESIMNRQDGSSAGTTQAGADGKTPATIKELRAAFPKDSDFAMDQAEKGHSLLEAKADYADYLEAKLRTRDEELANKDKELVEARKGGQQQPIRKGVQPLGSRRADGNTAVESGGHGRLGPQTSAFNTAVIEHMKLHGCDRQKATKAVSKNNPELLKAALDENNPGAKGRELLAEHFAGRA